MFKHQPSFHSWSTDLLEDEDWDSFPLSWLPLYKQSIDVLVHQSDESSAVIGFLLPFWNIGFTVLTHGSSHMLKISAQQVGPHPLVPGIHRPQAQLHRHRPLASRLSQQVPIWLPRLQQATVALPVECHTRLVQPYWADSQLRWSLQSWCPSCSQRRSRLIREWIARSYNVSLDRCITGLAWFPALVFAYSGVEASSVLVEHIAQWGHSDYWSKKFVLSMLMGRQWAASGSIWAELGLVGF